MNKIKLTKTFEKNLDAYRSGFRFIINKGSSRSSKTFSILQLLFLIAKYSEKRLIIHVVSYSTPHLRDGAITDFDTILTDAGEDLSKIKIKNPYTYTVNNSIIKFIGFDKAGKALGAKRDILFINEANNLIWSVVDQLLMRTTDRVFIDYNPSQVFWLTEQGINTRENATTIHSTFLDNLENLSESQLTEFKEMKRKHDEEEMNGIKGYWFNKWRVYGLGEEGIIEGMIFNNWSIGEFPSHLTSIFGIDWGVRDPFTLTEVAKNGNNLHVRQKVYKSGLTPNEVVDLIKAHVPKNALIIADNADTSMIMHCRNSGINIMPCLSKDKVVVGIFHLSNYDNIIITPESTDIINEFKNYIWLDKAGEVPIDKFNHCFVGGTLITTNEGPKRIDEIKVGDYVLNSSGYKKVLRCFDNGVQPVDKYLLQFENKQLVLESTKNHKIKTTEGWKEIGLLKPLDQLFLIDDKNSIQKQKLVAISILESKNEQVYDLMVDQVHEYIANGVLVHNCIDGIRYVEKFMRLKNL